MQVSYHTRMLNVLTFIWSLSRQVIGSSDQRRITLVALALFSLTIAGMAQPEQKLGDAAIARIEQFRRGHGRLPNSLAEAGMPDDKNGAIHYCITTSTSYILVYPPTTPGPLRLKTYRSTTKAWKEQGGGACIAPATPQERDTLQALEKLEEIPPDERPHRISELAIQLRRLPPSSAKINLAAILANESTEGEFDRAAAQAAITTLNEALREHPTMGDPSLDAEFYRILAQLVRYEHLQATLNDSRYSAAMAKLAADDERRGNIDFTLFDLSGKSWRLRDLGGKVVLVYFWAPWCFPCLKEMQDLQALYEQYEPQGLIVLGVTPEAAPGEIGKVVADRKITYPILLDKESKVWESFDVWAFSQLFVYDRNGKLLAQTPDGRTRKQLLELVAQAGIK